MAPGELPRSARGLACGRRLSRIATARTVNVQDLSSESTFPRRRWGALFGGPLFFCRSRARSVLLRRGVRSELRLERVETPIHAVLLTVDLRNGRGRADRSAGDADTAAVPALDRLDVGAKAGAFDADELAATLVRAAPV